MLNIDRKAASALCEFIFQCTCCILVLFSMEWETSVVLMRAQVCRSAWGDCKYLLQRLKVSALQLNNAPRWERRSTQTLVIMQHLSTSSWKCIYASWINHERVLEYEHFKASYDWRESYWSSDTSSCMSCKAWDVLRRSHESLLTGKQTHVFWMNNHVY